MQILRTHHKINELETLVEESGSFLTSFPACSNSDATQVSEPLPQTVYAKTAAMWRPVFILHTCKT